jgi:hypothetical protein
MNTAKMRASVLGVMGAGLLLAGAEAAEAPTQEVQTTLAGLPAVVRRVAIQESKGATVVGISREVDEGATVYEVAMKVNGRSRDIIIGADGTVEIAEDQVLITELPPAVRATLEKHAAMKKILLIETVRQRGNLAYYEAQLLSGKRTLELKIGLDGKRLPAK